MATVVAPTCEQLSNEELPLADRKVDDSWRHGVRVTAVYRRDEDGTFWQATLQQTVPLPRQARSIASSASQPPASPQSS